MRAGCGGKIEWQAGCYRRLGARAQCAGGGQGVTATPFTGRPATLRGFSVVAPGSGRVCRLWTKTNSNKRIFGAARRGGPPGAAGGAGGGGAGAPGAGGGPGGGP